MSNGKDTADETIDDVRGQAKRALVDAKDTIKDLTDNASDASAEARGAAQEPPSADWVD